MHRCAGETYSHPVETYLSYALTDACRGAMDARFARMPQRTGGTVACLGGSTGIPPASQSRTIASERVPLTPQRVPLAADTVPLTSNADRRFLMLYRSPLTPYRRLLTLQRSPLTPYRQD